MRCRKVRQHLSEGVALTDQDKQHIAACPKCARHAEAAGLLSKVFAAARSEEAIPESPFKLVRKRVETLESEMDRKEKQLMSRIVRQFSGRRRIKVAFAAAAVALLAVTLVPFSYERTVGYEVAFTGVDDEAVKSSDQVSSAIHLLGYGGVSVSYSQSDDGTSFWMMNLPSKAAAREAVAAFAAVTGCESEATITPVKKTVSGSLLAQVRDKIARVEIDAEGLNDAEIEDEIVTRLADLGFTGASASVNTGSDGMRQIDIGFETDASTTGSADLEIIILDEASEKIDFELDGGLDHAELRSLVKANVDMDESELKALLEVKLKEMGYAEATVVIRYSETGERQILVGKPKND